jgi:hypothetical protein
MPVVSAAAPATTANANESCKKSAVLTFNLYAHWIPLCNGEVAFP